MEPSLVRAVLDAVSAACRALPAATSSDEAPILAEQRGLLLHAGQRLVAAASAIRGDAPPGSAAAPAVRASAAGGPTATAQAVARESENAANSKRPPSALAMAAHARRPVRLLHELPPNVVIHACFFLPLRNLGALDATCQLFHPVGLTQKTCLMRAGLWLRAADWGPNRSASNATRGLTGAAGQTRRITMPPWRLNGRRRCARFAANEARAQPRLRLRG